VSETTRLKALAERVLRRDARRDTTRDTCSPGVPDGAEAAGQIVPARSTADDESLDARACLIESRLLGEAVWLVSDDIAAAELCQALERNRDRRLVFTFSEVTALRGMVEADARTLARVKRNFPGAALRRADKRRS
jgi:hypothetical protein